MTRQFVSREASSRVSNQQFHWKSRVGFKKSAQIFVKGELRPAAARSRKDRYTRELTRASIGSGRSFPKTSLGHVDDAGTRILGGHHLERVAALPGHCLNPHPI